MKIGVHWVQFEAGGVDTNLLSMIKNWPNDDHFVIFYNKDNEGLKRISSELEKYKVQLISFEIQKRSYISKLFQFVFFPIYFFWLRLTQCRVLQSITGLDAIMVQNGSYPGAWHSLAAVWAAHKINIKKRMLIIHHGALHSNIIHYPGEKIINYMIHAWATDIVAVSRATRQTLIDYKGFDPYRNPIRVVHNGIDISTDCSINPMQIRNKLKIDKNVILLGMIGRIERYKGHEDLLLAMNEVDSEMLSNLVVVFIGSGKTKEIDRLKEMACKLDLEDKVIFPGYLEGNSIQLISQLNILLMLTKDFEGFGLTIAEAMAAGIPVIATKVGGVQEFVDQTVSCLIPPESPSDIAKALTAYIKNPEDFNLRALKAKEHIKSFSGAKMSSQYCRLLNV